MTTVDEQILWLVAHGFTLPEGLYYEQPEVVGTSPQWFLGGGAFPAKQAHDLCAAHFAREIMEMPGKPLQLADYEDIVMRFYGSGQTAEAIDALYRAVKGSD